MTTEQLNKSAALTVGELIAKLAHPPLDALVAVAGDTSVITHEEMKDFVSPDGKVKKAFMTAMNLTKPCLMGMSEEVYEIDGVTRKPDSELVQEVPLIMLLPFAVLHPIMCGKDGKGGDPVFDVPATMIDVPKAVAEAMQEKAIQVSESPKPSGMRPAESKEGKEQSDNATKPVMAGGNAIADNPYMPHGEAFEKYVQDCYKGASIPRLQKRELRRAFFAGGITSFYRLAMAFDESSGTFWEQMRAISDEMNAYQSLEENDL